MQDTVRAFAVSHFEFIPTLLWSDEQRIYLGQEREVPSLDR